jgi:hypothetical protein
MDPLYIVMQEDYEDGGPVFTGSNPPPPRMWRLAPVSQAACPSPQGPSSQDQGLDLAGTTFLGLFSPFR